MNFTLNRKTEHFETDKRNLTWISLIKNIIIIKREKELFNVVTTDATTQYLPVLQWPHTHMNCLDSAILRETSSSSTNTYSGNADWYVRRSPVHCIIYSVFVIEWNTVWIQFCGVLMALYYIYAYLALSFFLFRRLIVQKYKTHKREHYVLKMDLFLSQVKIWGGTHSVGPVKEMFSVCGQLMAVHLSQNMRLRCYFVQVVLKKLH